MLTRLRLCAGLVIVAAATFFPTVAHAWVNPVRPQNRGAAIPGAINGALDPSLLVTVEGSCRLAHGAAPALAALLADARAQGVALGAADCYRPVDGQNSARSGACQSGNCACAATGGTPTTGGTSIHGWGKAVDFNENGITIGFDTTGYRWLKANAGRYAFNHPGFAEPGGSPCPEAWHWEWVGDGGSLGPAPRVVGIATSGDGRGYRTVSSYGSVSSFGTMTGAGSPDLSRLGAPVVGLLGTTDGSGYLMATGDGGVLSFGGASSKGSAAGTVLAAPVTGIAATPTGNGYWLVAADVRIIPLRRCGDVGPPLHLSQPMTGMSPTPTAYGYWLVAADGGIFAFGDAAFHGSTGNIHLNQPITGMAPTPTGNGYWLVAADGGIFTFGDAAYLGSGA
ncbi:MAG: hypothetical protein NVS3B12_26180 [Acidimicrobiales bacterium]